VSLDGYLDDATDRRLVLSNDADLDRVDAVRAGCDAILVGANTIRRDNPRLLVRSRERRDTRVARGLPPSPAKVTLTARGDLDPAASFFTAGLDAGQVQKIVYAASPALDKARTRLAAVATVVDAGEPLDLTRVLADLADRGIGRLMVEGGSTVHTGFLAAGLADELHLVVAPFLVGDSRAPRFAGDATFPWNPGNPARLAGISQIGDLVLLRYALSDRYGAT
jgi:5-amino-6-(5-phosphoribosylamino)uracil reductase